MAIQSVQRAIDILSHFSLSRPTLGIADLSQLMGLPKATVHGLVRTLLKNRLLQQDPETRKYRLGLKAFELGAIVGNTLEINRKAAEHLYALARRTGLETRLAIWDGESALLTMGAAVRSQAFFTQIGPRMPAYCSASGRVFLAYLAPGRTGCLPEQDEFCALHAVDPDRPDAAEEGTREDPCKRVRSQPGRTASRGGGICSPCFRPHGRGRRGREHLRESRPTVEEEGEEGAR